MIRCGLLQFMCLAISPSWVLASPEIPGAEQSQPIAIVNATIHPLTSPMITSGSLLFDQGKIVAVGSEIELPAGTRRIDAQGKHVYPGLICAGGQLGLIEIDSVRATRDGRETGSLNPNVKAQVAVNPDSELIPVTRANGVLLSLTIPTGGLLSGTSAVLQLDGWTWEDMTLHAPVGMHVQWPQMRHGNREGANDALKSLREAFDAAADYQRMRQAKEVNDARLDVRWEAMLPVFDGQIPIIVHAESALQIQAAVSFAVERSLKLIIYGGYDAPDVAELLRAHDVPLIIQSVYRLPRRRSDAFDASYTLPNRVRQAGLRYCIAGINHIGTSNLRNLPYHAATAVAYGLPEEEAIKAITLYPAQILGISSRVGSLEPGKDATLIVTTDSPLETACQVEQAFIQGRDVDLNSRHTRLWKKYRVKYHRMHSND